jgi:hypothetical protein
MLLMLDSCQRAHVRDYRRGLLTGSSDKWVRSMARAGRTSKGSNRGLRSPLDLGILDVLDLRVALLGRVVLVVDVPLGGERLSKVRAVAEVGAARAGGERSA